jgi:hypothetical protein
MHVFVLIRFTLFTVFALLLALIFPGAAAGVVFAKGGGGGGKVAAIFDPLGSALGLHDAITGGEEAPVEPAVDPTAPPATSPVAATAADTAAAEEADRLAKAADEEDVRRRRLTAQTSLTGPLGLPDSETYLTRRSLLG